MQTLVLVLIMFEYSECGGEAVCRGLAVVSILGYTLNILNSGGHRHSWAGWSGFKCPLDPVQDDSESICV